MNKFWFFLLLYISSSNLLAETVDMVRVEVGKHSMDVIYQQFDGKKWLKQTNLTENNKLDEFTPVVIRDATERMMVVWVEAQGAEAAELKFRIQKGDDWSKVGTINTSTGHVSMPTLLLDKQNRIWCFWVGFDGSDDEIYFSLYDENQWRKAKKLYGKDNTVPDIFPLARLDDQQRPVVLWRRLDPKAFIYKTQQSTLITIAGQGNSLSEVAWSKTKQVVANPFKSITMPVEFTFPQEVSRPDSAALYFPRFPNYVIQPDRIK